MLIAAGDQDTMTTQEFCAVLADGQDNVTIRQVTGAGHWLPVEDVPATSALVLDFIRPL